MAAETNPNNETTHPAWQMGIDNLSLPPQLALTGSAAETREYLHRAGMQQGLDWLPTPRTRLFFDIGSQAVRGTFQNEEQDWSLIGSMKQSFSQRVPRIRNVRQVGERLLMPPVRSSLLTMQRMQTWVGRTLPADLYTEALKPGEVYNDANAPFSRGQIISPDLAYKRGYDTMDALTDDLHRKGIDHFTFDTVHSIRQAQDNPDTYLQPWREWLPGLLRSGKIGQLSVSFARGDLKPRHSAAIGKSYDQLSEILSGDPNDAHLGDLPAQLNMIRDMTPADALPLVTIHAGATSIENARPGLKPVEGHRLLAGFVADRLGFRLPDA